MTATLRIASLLALLTPALAPGLALAHAHLSRTEPGAGATVRVAPAQVEITFTGAVEPRFSSVSVTDGAGTSVDKQDVHIVAGDPRRLAVSVGVLKAGVYKVLWKATSVDTHQTEGSFSFTVEP